MTRPTLAPQGRTWLFGNSVDTDAMFPGFAMRLPPGEAAQHMFDALRPGWPDRVEPGDVIVGGRRFGLGSARPVGQLLRELRISCVLAEEFSSLFLRNTMNWGVPVLTVPGVRSLFEEGQTASVDMEAATVTNLATGRRLAGRPYPRDVLDVVRDGGIEASLRRRGLIVAE